MQTWIRGEENVNSKIKITLQEPPHTTQLDTSRKIIVPDNLKATMNASQCSQLESQLASGALVALRGEPFGLVQ